LQNRGASVRHGPVVGVEDVGVAKDFRRPERDQGFLLPPDMREWLPQGHLVWFVIDAVDQLDLTGFARRAKIGAAGRAPLDPAMLVTLLIYAYAHGERSSRQIERLCAVDIAFRVICGNDGPDHTTIARFRAAHDAAFAELFTQVLVMCARAGLGRFGTVAIDGTKIAASAAKSANRSLAALRAEADRVLAEAAAVDAEEDELFGDARGDELPEQFTDPRTRAANIKKALEEIAAEQAAEAEANAVDARVEHWQQRVADSERRLADTRADAEARWQQWESGQRRGGTHGVPPEEHVLVHRARQRLAWARDQHQKALRRSAKAPTRRASTVVNVTDPQSRLLKAREGFVQGYNAQLAVTDDQLIAAVDVITASPDVNAFVPMMTAVVEAAETITVATGVATTVGVVVADAGYLSTANLTAAGPDRLIATGDRRHLDSQADATPTHGPPPRPLNPLEAMRHRMRDPEHLQTYRRRALTVEPVNGMIKDRHGLRRFTRRGQRAALGELNLTAAVHNLLKLHRAAPATG
jgi:transposase